MNLMNLFFVLQATAAPAGKGNYSSLLFLLLIIVVFWLFMIRPQRKQQKELQNYRNSLRKGDKIITTGGIYGKVLEVVGNAVIIEVEGQSRLKVSKEAILRDMNDPSYNQNAPEPEPAPRKRNKKVVEDDVEDANIVEDHK